MKQWKTVGYVRRGLSHIAKDSACQDRASVRENDQCIAAVLADGIGSLPHSEIAADAVVEQLVRILVPSTSGADAQEASARKAQPVARSTDQAAYEQRLREMVTGIARTSIVNAARKQGLDEKSMDCTLAYVWLDKPSGKALAGIIGDGAVCIFWKDGRAEALTNQGRLANMTDTVLGDGGAARMRIRILDVYQEGICGFLLTSDGLENELYMKNTTFVFQEAGAYLNSIWEGDDPEDALSDRIDRLTLPENSQFDDDISIAAIACLERPVALPPDPTWQCACLRRNPVSCTRCLSCGLDMTDIYRGVSMAEHGGRPGWFRYLNQHPEEERERVERFRRERNMTSVVSHAPDLQETTVKQSAEGAIPGFWSDEPSGITKPPTEPRHPLTEELPAPRMPRRRKPDFQFRDAALLVVLVLCLLLVLFAVLSMAGGGGVKGVAVPEASVQREAAFHAYHEKGREDL